MLTTAQTFTSSIQHFRYYVSAIYGDAESSFKLANQSWLDCDTIVRLIILLKTEVRLTDPNLTPSTSGYATELLTRRQHSFLHSFILPYSHSLA